VSRYDDVLRASLVVVVWFVLSGCGSSGVRELNRAALRQSAPRSVAGVVGPAPRFLVSTHKSVSFVAAAIQSSLDARRLRLVGLHDPARAIAEALIDALAKRFSLDVLDANDQDQGLKPHLMLRIQTINWGLQVAPTGGAAISYEGTLELTDTRTHEVLARATCVSHPLEGQSVSALGADGSSLLRDELREATEYCIEDYRHRILGLY
jgi:hypothetical protein